MSGANGHESLQLRVVAELNANGTAHGNQAGNLREGTEIHQAPHLREGTEIHEALRHEQIDTPRK